MLYVIAGFPAALIGGVALGWFLRKKERWCGWCGGRLICEACCALTARKTTGAVRSGLAQSEGRQ